MIPRRGSASRRWFAACCTAASLAAPVTALTAQDCGRNAATHAPRAWAAPLDRLVSLRARGTSLRTALDELAAASDVSFAYSPDLLALERRVCVVAERQALGSTLELLLRGSGVVPSVVAGRIVLVPGGRETAGEATGAHADLLDRVVVTGNALATLRRPLTIGVEVIEGERLRRQSLGSLAEMLNSSMPGAWVWEATPGSVLAQYGGIRGASSFGTSAPKIYLDGVEVANPLVVTQLDPDAIERIEVIRGPQGSALYGSDAISGVVNVLTRHDGAAPTGARVLLSSTVGAGRSAFGPALVPTHEQRLALRVGSPTRSAGLAAQFGQSGAVFPSASTRQTTLTADARAVGRAAVWSGTARLSDRIAGVGRNPLLGGALPAEPMDSGTSAATITTAPDGSPQHARQYTAGASVAVGGAGRFTHSLMLGVDGYRLAHVAMSASSYPVPGDSAFAGAAGAGDRTTIRASTVGHFGGEGAPAATVTVGVDQSTLRLELPVSNVTAPPAGLPYAIARDGSIRQWNHNAGLFAQVGAAWHDALFASAGLRVERNDAFTGADRHPLLPMLGVAGVHDFGPASLKLRAAYGRGIRPPSVPARGTWLERGSASTTAPSLDPESQAGTEVGAELYVGSLVSLQLTRFDQLASGLIQNVLLAVDTQMRAGRPQQHMSYQLQNVGEIGNHGWEVQGAFTHRAFTLSSAVAFVDSRVRTLAPRYAGDLRPGDLMLGVPTRTATMSASWNAQRWTGALTASRAARWVNYDRQALARDYAGAGAAAGELVGARLRSYWMDYDGDTHVRVAGTRALRGTLELVLVGDNLLGGQLGEPDNVTIRPGRTISAGFRAGF
ncbi:MAG: TonB-dependent receptor plug [Gemmatimonadetes bacterium]|nr:TonB-dependent receptor plug [Gemmatimonadota bacterium]